MWDTNQRPVVDSEYDASGFDVEDEMDVFGQDEEEEENINQQINQQINNQETQDDINNHQEIQDIDGEDAFEDADEDPVAAEFGILFKDQVKYNYLQHLKPITNGQYIASTPKQKVINKTKKNNNLATRHVPKKASFIRTSTRSIRFNY